MYNFAFFGMQFRVRQHPFTVQIGHACTYTFIRRNTVLFILAWCFESQRCSQQSEQYDDFRRHVSAIRFKRKNKINPQYTSYAIYILANHAIIFISGLRLSLESIWLKVENKFTYTARNDRGLLKLTLPRAKPIMAVHM